MTVRAMTFGARAHTVLVGVVAGALALLAAGCSDDEPDPAPTSAPTTAETTTTTTISDEEFTATAESFEASLAEAGTDFCAVVEAATVQFATAPANAAQVEQTVRMQTLVMEALAATEPVDEENAALLRQTAERFTQAAQQASYSEEFLASEEASDILMGADFQRALDAYYQRAEADCDVPETPADLGGGAAGGS